MKLLSAVLLCACSLPAGSALAVEASPSPLLGRWSLDTATSALPEAQRPKQVVLECDPPSPPVKDAQGRSKIGITATTKISRKDFGVVGDELDGAVEAGGIIVSDQVSIELDIEIMPPSQASIVGPAKH